jgi:PAS domain S-box-containing protein
VEQARLAALESFGLGREADDTFDRIARLAAARLGCAMAFVSIVDATRQWTKGVCGADRHDRPRDGTFCARAMDHADIVVVNEPAADPLWRDVAAAPHYQGIRFYAAAPLRTRDGHALGTLCVADTRPHAFDAEDREALRDLGAIAMDALDLRRTLRAGARARQRLAEREALLAAILDTAVDAIITIDTEGRILSANRAAERMFDYAASELVGRNVSMLMPAPHDARHDGYLARYLRDGGARVIGMGREVPCRRADGSLFVAEMAVSETRIPGIHVFTGLLRDLTDRKRAEEQLRRHIELVRLAEETVSLGHWRLDFASQQLFWSDEVYRIHGVDPRTYVPTLRSALDFCLPGDAERVMAGTEEAIRQRRQFDRRYSIRRADGDLRVIHSCARVQVDEAGAAVALVGTFQDITERVRIEQELERSRERLERSTTYSNIGIWEWDVEGGHVWWSEQVGLIFGLGEGTMMVRHETFLDAVHAEDRPAVEASLAAALEDRGPYEVEHRVLHPDGMVRWVQSRGAVECDAAGRPTRMLGVVQDVTRAKEAELALKESRRLLAMAIDNISDGFVLMDDHDRVVLWNDRLLDIFPYLKSHIAVGVRFEDLVRRGATDGQFADAVGRIEDWVTERMARHAGAEEHHEERLANGRWVRVAERRMDNGWRVGIRTDITEIRRVQEEAQAANRAKSEFLSKMSHELRTPLNAILGFAQLLQVSRKEPLSETQNRHVGHILEGGRHLLDLINEVLDLARVEAGRLTLCLEPIDPAPIIGDCLGMARTLAGDRGIQVTADPPPGAASLPRVIADATRLRQVLLNLLSNAVKYNRIGGEVRVSIVADAERLSIAVADTGPGLSAEAQVRVFEPFNRLGAETSKTEGAGIGLTITRQLVDLMNGGISVDSRVGEGATFTVSIPVAAAGGEQA